MGGKINSVVEQGSLGIANGYWPLSNSGKSAHRASAVDFRCIHSFSDVAFDIRKVL